jgi:hypothetical protein
MVGTASPSTDEKANAERVYEALIGTDVLPPLATSTQVSQFVQVSVDSLAQDRYRGRGIPFVKISGRVRYLREDVLNYLAANRMQRTDDPRGAMAL